MPACFLRAAATSIWAFCRSPTKEFAFAELPELPRPRAPRAAPTKSSPSCPDQELPGCHQRPPSRALGPGGEKTHQPTPAPDPGSARTAGIHSLSLARAGRMNGFHVQIVGSQSSWLCPALTAVSDRDRVLVGCPGMALRASTSLRMRTASAKAVVLSQPDSPSDCNGLSGERCAGRFVAGGPPRGASGPRLVALAIFRARLGDSCAAWSSQGWCCL